MENRIWIELERPPAGLPPEQRREVGEKRAELATAVLAKLAGPAIGDYAFGWDDHERRYTYGSPMGSHSLVDNGEWFNLDFLAKGE